MHEEIQRVFSCPLTEQRHSHCLWSAAVLQRVIRHLFFFFFFPQRFSTGEASGMAAAKGLAVGNCFAHCKVVWISSGSSPSIHIMVRVPKASHHFQFVLGFTSLVFWVLECLTNLITRIFVWVFCFFFFVGYIFLTHAPSPRNVLEGF